MNRNPRHRFPPNPEQGTVIVLVLVTLLLAAFLLTAFIRRSGAELLVDARAGHERELRLEAYSALETALALVAAERTVAEPIHRIDPDWPARLAAAGYTARGGRQVTVSFEDESARLSLPNATPAQIAVVLTRAGLDPVRADAVAELLRAWMDPVAATGALPAGLPDYDRHDPPYRPPGRPPIVWSELAAIGPVRDIFYDEAGRETAPARALRREFSLHAFGRSNLNTASPAVLAALGVETAGRPRDETNAEPWRSLPEAVAALGGAVLPDTAGTQVELLRVNVTVRQGALHHRLTAVTRLAGPAAAEPVRKRLDYPVTLLEIRENPEPVEPVTP